MNNRKKSHAGLWILIVAGIVLESISCVQYFTSRISIKHEAELRAKTELRKAELEIEKHTIEMEAAAKMLAMLAQKHIESPDSIYAATRSVVKTIEHTSSIAVAFVPNFYPKHRFFEACSSRISKDSIYTRQIGSAEHDYTQMEWFQNGFVHDSCWWSEPYLDDSGSQTYVVSCSYPVRNGAGEVVAVVCIDLSLDYLQQVSEYLQVYPNSFYSIRSSNGLSIVPAPDTIPGRKYNIYHEEIDATGWHIEIIIPEDELFADLNRIGLMVTILMLIGLLILALILVYTTRTVRKMIAFSEQNQRMESELEVAQTIQMAMLPKVFPPFAVHLVLFVYGFVRPAKEVGGDLYDFYIRSEKLFFCIGDVSGKGVPASLLMATTRSLFRSVTSHEEEAEAIVTEMNQALSDANEQNMFITLFLGVLDLNSGKLSYCNAGHNAPIIARRKKDGTHEISSLDVKPNLPIGVMSDFIFRAQTTQIGHNDVLFLYTDGLSEAENNNKVLFGEERIMKCLHEVMRFQPRVMIDKMYETVEKFVGTAQQSDDLTMLGIRYQTPALIMRNDIQQIPTLAEWIEWLQIPEHLNMPINLALEEAVSNVMLYAYPKDKSGQVMVESWRWEDAIYFTISDSGIPFDPTQKEEADITLSAEERSIGGLGIHLVKQLMDKIEYRREDNKNILTLMKKLNYKNNYDHTD